MTMLDGDAAVVASSLPARAASSSRVPLILLAALVIAAVAGSIALLRSRAEPVGQPMYVDVATPSSSSVVAAISPDGRKIVFGAYSDAGPQLWIRLLDSPAAKPLPHTERGQFPFWSPDSRSIAFYIDRSLKRLDIETGTAQTLTSALPFGGAWNRDGVILIGSPRDRSFVFRNRAGNQ
jgi:Tol biopolymer transport system component